MKAPVTDCLMPYADTEAWVAWNAERRGGEMRKVPKCPRTGANASVSDPRTWGTLAAALRLAEVRAYPGVGIISSAVPALVFLDLDRCIDAATGDPTNDDATRLLDASADTYAERTPSGLGVRIIGTAAAIEATVSRKGTTHGGLALEIYKSAPRYLTVTGHRYGEHPDELADIGDVVLDLLPLLSKATPTEGSGDGRADAELVRAIATSEGFHAELCALAARYIGRGISATATVETLRGLMLAHPEAARNDRWRVHSRAGGECRRQICRGGGAPARAGQTGRADDPESPPLGRDARRYGGRGRSTRRRRGAGRRHPGMDREARIGAPGIGP